MLIHIPSISIEQGFVSYYNELRHILKEAPYLYCTVDNSSQCVYPMNLIQILIQGNWDKKIVDWFRWVNRNICLQLGYDDQRTIMVKLRIATGMLNNIESLTDLEKIQIHSNLTDNIYREMYSINVEGLPF